MRSRVRALGPAALCSMREIGSPVRARGLVSTVGSLHRAPRGYTPWAMRGFARALRLGEGDWRPASAARAAVCRLSCLTAATAVPDTGGQGPPRCESLRLRLLDLPGHPC